MPRRPRLEISPASIPALLHPQGQKRGGEAIPDGLEREPARNLERISLDRIRGIPFFPVIAGKREMLRLSRIVGVGSIAGNSQK
jgi:hypothetical protein